MATGDKLVNLDELKLVYDKLHVPSVQVQIPTGQWSGSSTRTYTVNATGVTANTIVDWAMDSSINYLTSDLTVTPGSGTITFSTPTLPAGTINVTLFFPGVNGEVVIQTLADVYSKSQTDALIAQSTTVAITSEYTSVLSAINAYRNTKVFPFTIQKSGNTTYYDIPSGVANTCEWNVICVGNSRRITALLTIYSGASLNNGRIFTANIFNGSYIYDFADIPSTATVKTVTATPGSGVTLGNGFSCLVVGNILIINGYIALNSTLAGNYGVLFTLPAEYAPSNQRYVPIFANYSAYPDKGDYYTAYLRTNGVVSTETGGGTFSGNIKFSSIVIPL